MKINKIDFRFMKILSVALIMMNAISVYSTEKQTMLGCFYEKTGSHFWSIGLTQRNNLNVFKMNCSYTNSIGVLFFRLDDQEMKKILNQNNAYGAIIESTIGPIWGNKYFEFGPHLGLSGYIVQNLHRINLVEGDIGIPFGISLYGLNVIQIKTSLVKYIFPRNIHTWTIYNYDLSIMFSLSFPFR